MIIILCTFSISMLFFVGFVMCFVRYSYGIFVILVLFVIVFILCFHICYVSLFRLRIILVKK